MNPPSTDPATPRSPPGLLLVLAYLAFVSLGLPDTVLGIAWPSVRGEFRAPQPAMGAVLAAGAAAYFLSGLFAGRLMHALGLGALLAGSTALVAVGVTGYGTAPAFAAFVAAACLVGFGSGAVDSGLNAYAASAFGPRHMNWLHAAYSVGAAIGPVLMTSLLARGAGWRTGYLVIAVTLGVLAVAFLGVRRQWTRAAPSGAPDAPAAEVRARSDASPREPALTAWGALRHPGVGYQIALFFLYAGVEVGAGQWSFTVLTESRGLAPAVAGAWVSAYWASILVGRIASGFVVEALGPVRLLRAATALAAVATAVFAAPGLPRAVGGAALVALGLSLAPIFPGLMSETPGRLGPRAAAYAVGFQVSAATAGVALLPTAAGLVGARFGLATIPVLLAANAAALALLHEGLLRSLRR